MKVEIISLEIKGTIQLTTTNPHMYIVGKLMVIAGKQYEIVGVSHAIEQSNANYEEKLYVLAAEIETKHSSAIQDIKLQNMLS